MTAENIDIYKKGAYYVIKHTLNAPRKYYSLYIIAMNLIHETRITKSCGFKIYDLI